MPDNINFLDESNALLDEFSQIRHTIHRNPETGNHEFKTAALVEAFLNDLGIKTERVTETGIVGTLRFDSPGKTIAFRADMDALPITEKTGCAFSSQNAGLMHACGHDVHTSALLCLAKLLSLHRDVFCGCVKFFFQPDEEDEGGARRMINAGCMKDVSAVYGAHVDPFLPSGTVGVRYGKFYAASNIFNVTVHGKSAHGASPEKGRDALLCAAKMVLSLKELPKSFPEGEALLSTGTLKSGTARNIIADKASFTGIIRTLGNEVRDGMLAAFKKTINDICAQYGTSAEIYLNSTHNGVVNTDSETELVQKAAGKAKGITVRVIEKPLMTSEDFGFFIDEAKGSYYHIGAPSPHPLHSSEFLPPDETIAVTAAVHMAVAYAKLAVSK